MFIYKAIHPKYNAGAVTGTKALLHSQAYIHTQTKQLKSIYNERTLFFSLPKKE